MANLPMYGDPIGEIVFGSPIYSVPVPTTTVNIRVLTRHADLNGFSFEETTGTTAAALDIYDGLDTTGTLVAVINLSANESIRDWFGVFGIRCKSGVFINVKSGSVRGAVWLRV